MPLAYPAGNANYEAVAQIVQANLEAVGIKTELQPAEYSQFIKQLIGGTFGGLWILQHAYAQYTPSTLAVSAYPFNADKNASHFESTALQGARRRGVGAGQRHRRRRRSRTTRSSTRTCSTTCS